MPTTQLMDRFEEILAEKHQTILLWAGVAHGYLETLGTRRKASRLMTSNHKEAAANGNPGSIHLGALMPTFKRGCVVLLLISALACSSPTTPTTSSIAVTGTVPNVGQTRQLTAKATLSSGTSEDVTAQATWSSSNTAVATVTAGGRLTLLQLGAANITAAYQAATGTLSVSVNRNTDACFGTWAGDGFRYPFAHFTVATQGPVDATADISGAGRFRLAWLGFNAAADPQNPCGLQWLTHPIASTATTNIVGAPYPPTAFVFGVLGERVKRTKKAWETCVLRAHGHEPRWIEHGKLSADSRAALKVIDLRFHDLRHEAGSRWLEGGWPIHHVKEMLGHANISQTDTYLNVSRLGLHESMQRFDDVRCKTVASQPPIEHRRARNGDPHEAGKDLLH